jgi:Tol biopolymer transport system component
VSTDSTNTPPKKDDSKVDQLLREAIAAVKLGDKVTARTKLQEVVSLDQYNEKGWYWLASVVETDEERKVCLGNVVVINPDNQRAQQMLNRLSQPKSTNPFDLGETPVEEPAKKLQARRMPLLLGGIGAILVVLLLAVFVLGRGSGGEPLPTVAELPTQIPDTPTSPVAAGTAMGGATNLPPTLPGGAPTLPPTWTSQPTATRSGPQTGTPLASPPPGLTGRLVAQYGLIITADKTLPLVLLDLTGKTQRNLTPSDRGDFGYLTPDGQRLIYSRYVSGTNTYLVRIVNLSGTQPIELNTLWNNQPPLTSQQTMSFSRSGRGVVFSAINLAENDSTPDIYYLPVRYTSTAVPTDTVEAPKPRATVAGEAQPTAAATSPYLKVSRLTAKDSGTNTWPAISADGRMVAFVADTTAIGGEGINLYVEPVTGGEPKNLTADLQASAILAPEWSPDGSFIAFQVTPSESKTNEIYVMNADGSNKKKIISGPGDNIRPHWSPDGKYLAFSSTRTGKWEIFIIEVATGNIFQVTQSKDTMICTSWA